MRFLTVGELRDRASEISKHLRDFVQKDRKNLTFNELVVLNQLLDSSRRLKDIVDDLGMKPITGVLTYERTCLVAPGNGYTSTIEAICNQLLFSQDWFLVLVSSRDTLGHEFVQYMHSVGYDHVEVPNPTWSHKEKLSFVENFDPELLVVYGSDETLKAYADVASFECSFVGYGSKSSIGIHADANTLLEHVDEYAEDFFLYDGTGCLNTSVLYVRLDLNSQNSDLAKIKIFAEQLGEKREHFIPSFQGLTVMKNLQIQLMKTGIEYHQVNGLFIREPMVSNPAFGGGHGTGVIVPFRSLADISQEWKGHSNHLSSATFYGREVILQGQQDWNHSTKRFLWNLGVTRITTPGQAQKPTHRWTHDGMSPIPELMYQSVIDEG